MKCDELGEKQRLSRMPDLCFENEDRPTLTTYTSRGHTMQLKDLSGTLVRRWYLTLAGLLAVGGVCVGVFELIPPTFETEANVVLLPPESSVGEGGNPYLYLGGLDQAADVLTRALTSDASRTQVMTTLGHADYDVLPDWATSGPILIITGRGDSAAQADEVRQAVLESVPSTLVVLQKALNVPDGSQITSMVLTSDDKPTPVVKARMRAVAAAGAASLVAVVMLIGLLDGMLKTRTLRRSRRLADSNASAAAMSSTASAQSDPTPAGAGAPEPSRRSVRDDAARDLTSEGSEESEPSAALEASGVAEDAAESPETEPALGSSIAELNALLQLPSRYPDRPTHNDNW